MENKFPKRKHPRLKTFDYSSAGSYFITVCTYNRQCTLSRVSDVIEGTADADAHCDIEYTEFGEIALRELYALEDRYPCLTVDNCVIMPNHIHAIFILNDEQTDDGARRPTIMEIVCAYKSIVTRLCKKISSIENVFQTSFYEHIIRNYDDYKETVKYIYGNPLRWRLDELHP